MEGIAGVTARITQIQATIASLNPAPARSAASTVGASAFGSVLSDAVDAQRSASTGSTTAPRAAGGVPVDRFGAAGVLGADGVPVDLARFGNGKIPADALAPIGVGSHRLWQPAAEAFTQLGAAAAAAGVKVGVTDSYRSYEGQVDVARRKGLYSEGGLAARPGTSDHGWGRSLDLDLDPKAQQWMRDNAARFGFVEDVPREPWHWTFAPPA